MANNTAALGTTTATEITRIIRQPEVERLTGLSGDSIDLLEERRQFPRRVPLTVRTVGWVESEVACWIQERIALRDDAVKAAQLRFDRAPPAVRHRLRMQREQEPTEATELTNKKRSGAIWTDVPDS
jgi:prophage regulatory protein